VTPRTTRRPKSRRDGGSNHPGRAPSFTTTPLSLSPVWPTPSRETGASKISSPKKSFGTPRSCKVLRLSLSSAGEANIPCRIRRKQLQHTIGAVEDTQPPARPSNSNPDHDHRIGNFKHLAGAACATHGNYDKPRGAAAPNVADVRQFWRQQESRVQRRASRSQFRLRR
jgi:hypothetical protein